VEDARKTLERTEQTVEDLSVFNTILRDRQRARLKERRGSVFGAKKLLL
jgi:hypothetical protein